MVVGSAAGLSALIIAMLVYLSGFGVFSSPKAMRALAIGGIVYLIAAVLLARIGLSGIADLERLGLTDSLSGVPNRRALHLDVARHAHDGDEVALALIDLDGFKAINDQHGHFVGDKLIKRCAAILREICADEARFYRLGGDEFAIVVIDPIASNILESTCRRLLQRLAQPLVIDDRNVTIGASIGMARTSQGAPASSSELLRRADVAMYASKAGGKMRCTWFIEDFDRSREEIAQGRKRTARGHRPPGVPHGLPAAGRCHRWLDRGSRGAAALGSRGS